MEIATTTITGNVYDDDDWETDPEESTHLFNCVDCWQNARADQRKKMSVVFAESGIFVVTC